MIEELPFAIASLTVAIFLIFASRFIIGKKMRELQGSQKLVGIILGIIVVVEFVYLGFTFGLFEFALEVITSIGVGMVLFGIALQHQLKNIVAGIGLFFGKEVNVGDIISVKENRGTIVELHLTKTIALTDEGERIIIPNQKFADEIILLKHKQKRN